MVTITAPEYDPAGLLLIAHPARGSDMDSVSRRSQRSATLDGSAVIVDHGFSDADRTLTVVVEPVTAEQVRTAQRLTRLYTRVLVATAEAVFTGTLSVRIREVTMTLQIEVSERISP
jgi:hypothetical protein